MTTFSIAIPVFGQQQFIPTALKSIMAQQGVDCELAIMDATPDTSVQEILRQYTDIISYSRHGEDGGQSEAIEEGWANTSGDIVGWLCADDYYFPDALKSVQDIFENHPEIDVVYGDSVYVDVDGGFKMYFPSIESDVSCLPVHDCIAQPSCFVRRSALDKVGGLNVDLHYIMDWDLWVRLYRSGARFYYLHKLLSVTRIYPETKTSSMSLKRYSEINKKLKLQPSFFKRVRTLVGMLHSDLAENERNFAMNLVFACLNLYIGVKRKVVVDKVGLLYGLEKRTNKVNDLCTISLPWYGLKPPQLVMLTTSSGEKVSLSVQGTSLECCAEGLGDKKEFTIPCELNGDGTGVWEFQLQVMHPCYVTAFALV